MKNMSASELSRRRLKVQVSNPQDLQKKNKDDEKDENHLDSETGDESEQCAESEPGDEKSPVTDF